MATSNTKQMSQHKRLALGESVGFKNGGGVKLSGAPKMPGQLKTGGGGATRKEGKTSGAKGVAVKGVKGVK